MKRRKNERFLLNGQLLSLAGWQGETHNALPIPPAYVTDTGGTTRFGHSKADYTQRLSADELRAGVDAVLSTSQTWKNPY